MDDNPIDRRAALGLMGMAGGLAYASGLLAQKPSNAIFAAGHESLRDRAARKGLLCGSELTHEELVGDPREVAAVRADSNIVVAGNELKWKRLQPDPHGPLRFEKAEAIYEFAKQNGMLMRGHTLTWYRAEPAWAADAIRSLSAGGAGDMLTRYVDRVVRHWRGRLAHWDVANEPVDGEGRLNEKLYSSKLGEQYIDLAFHAARNADPAAILMINTELVEMNEPYQERHRAAMLRLLEGLLHRGVPVQALGIEGHISTLHPFSETRYRRFLDEVTAMGLKLIVTEFDVLDNGILGSVDDRDEGVAALGKAFLDVTLSYRQCLGILTWGMSDRHSWLRTVPGKQRYDKAPLRPSPLDENFRRKPLWYAMAAALDGAPVRSIGA